MTRRSLIQGCLLALAIGTVAAAVSHAGSSWSLRQLEEGWGRWVLSYSDRFLILGGFEQYSAWISYDGGYSGEPTGENPPVPADSIVGVSAGDYGCMVLGATGDIWRTWSGYWWDQWASFPDSLGHPTAICRADARIWVGTNEGELFRRDDPDSGWQAVRQLAPAAVRQIASRGSGRAMVLLEDGSLFVQDSVWIEAPFRADIISLPPTEPAAGAGHALESGNHTLWRTTDGGTSWSILSTALAAPEFIPWIGQARKLIVAERWPGLGLIPCGDALLASEDAGITWRIAAMGTGMFLDAAVDEIGAGNILTAGARIHRSTDWAFSLNQIIGGDFSSVVMGSPSTLWALDAGLLLTVDYGSSWLRLPLPESPERLRRIAARGSYEIWLHFDGPEGCHTYHSTNRGIDLDSFDTEGHLHGLRDWSFPYAGVGWAITDSTLLRSEDDGEHWQVVLDKVPGIDALAAHDSLHAAVSAGERVYLTGDGGISWQEGTIPIGIPLRALAFSGTDALVGVGRTTVHITGSPPWNEALVSDLGDTLHGVVMSDEGRGWAVGNAGLLVDTFDGGRSWQPYRVDLQISALRCRFSQISAYGTSYAVTGSGTNLVLLSPDSYGPYFRLGISMNPYLSRYLDIHITAHERLLDDSLHVAIDGEEIATEFSDPEGFLYRARYHIPMRPGNREMVVRGSDWLGNERTQTYMLATATLDRGGAAKLEWDGETLLLAGTEGGATALLESAEEIPPLPEGWTACGRPFQIATQGTADIRPVAERRSLVCLLDGAWRFLGPEPDALQDGAVLMIARDAASPPAQERTEPVLRLFPVPTREILSVDWRGLGMGPLSWEIFDVTGSQVSSGASARDASEIIQVRTIDSGGRRLAAGVYWLRVRDGSATAVRPLVITR